MNIEHSKAYSVFVVSYRPELEQEYTIPFAVFLYTDKGVFYSKRSDDWDTLLALDPNADTKLLSEILDEMEAQSRQNRELLHRSSEWSNSIEVTFSTLTSAASPEIVLQEMLDALRARFACS